MITPAEAKAARTLLGWSQSDVNARVGVGKDAIGDFERRDRLSLTLDPAKLERTFESAGAEFTNGKRPSVRLRNERK
jgi:transcriptional regulator with XRE-family HTH domain